MRLKCLALDFGSSNRTTCYYNVTEFDPGWFSRTENCTSQFTDKFGIIREVFRALSNLDPESHYLTRPKQCIWTEKSRIFRNTTERQTQNETEYWSRTMHWNKSKANLVKNKQCSFKTVLNNSQSKAAQVSCTGFWIKQPNCMLP